MFNKTFGPKRNKTTGWIEKYEITYHNVMGSSHPDFNHTGVAHYDVKFAEDDKLRKNPVVDRDSVKLVTFGSPDTPWRPVGGAPGILAEDGKPSVAFVRLLQKAHEKVHVGGRDRFG